MDLEAPSCEACTTGQSGPKWLRFIQPNQIPSCNVSEASKALALVQRHRERAPQSKTAAWSPQAPLTRSAWVSSLTWRPVGTGQPPLALFSSLILMKGCPQADCPVVMIPVLCWLLNKVQRLSERAFVGHGQKHARESLQGLLGSSAQKHPISPTGVGTARESARSGRAAGKVCTLSCAPLQQQKLQWQGATESRFSVESLLKIWLHPFFCFGTTCDD